MREHEEKIRKECENTFRGYRGTEESKEQVLNQIYGIIQGVGFVLGDKDNYWYKIYEEYETKIED